MAGPKEMLRQVAKQGLTLGFRVGRSLVREFARRIASRIRDQVDLESEPSSPTPPQPEVRRSPDLVVTPPPGGEVGTRASSLGKAAKEHAAAQPGGVEQAPGASVTAETRPEATAAFRLFDRVTARPAPGQAPVTGEIYEIHGSSTLRYDILTYTEDGIPRLVSGLEASALAPFSR